MPDTHAVVLSGGGADGAYEVGVLRALVAGRAAVSAGRPLVPQIWTGTSIGSLNAAFLVAREDGSMERAVRELEEVWLDRLARRSALDRSEGYRFRLDPAEALAALLGGREGLRRLGELAGDGFYVGRMLADRAAHFLTTRKSVGERLLETANISSFVSREPFLRLLREVVPFEAIRGSDRALRVAVTNWGTGKLQVFGNDRMSSEFGPLAIMASTAIPGFFPPVDAGSQRYVDGGVLMNTPLKPAIDAGADVLHLVYLDPDVQDIPLGRFDSILDTMYRLSVITWAARLDGDIAQAQAHNRAVANAEVFRHAMTSDSVRAAFEAAGISIEERLERARKWRRLTIHRYHPRDDLGGPLGLLNVSADRLRLLMERGARDTEQHDCASSGCVLP